MIQIDMPMPTNCIDCPFSLDNCCLVLGKYISLKQWAKGEIQKWCPLKEQPQIVRCKDCKFGYCINPSCDYENRFYECMKYPIANLRITHKPDWFCADGERR